MIKAKNQTRQCSNYLLKEKDYLGLSGDWVIKKLGEIVNIRKGHQKNKDMLSNKGEYPVINGGIEPSGYTLIGIQKKIQLLSAKVKFMVMSIS